MNQITYAKLNDFYDEFWRLKEPLYDKGCSPDDLIVVNPRPGDFTVTRASNAAHFDDPERWEPASREWLFGPPEVERTPPPYLVEDLQRVVANIGAWRRSKGFETPESFDETEALLAKLALIHEEISEAVSAVRTGDFGNFCEEIADAFIRICDTCYALDIDLAREVEDKMLVNETRPHMHNKRA